MYISVILTRGRLFTTHHRSLMTAKTLGGFLLLHTPIPVIPSSLIIKLNDHLSSHIRQLIDSFSISIGIIVIITYLSYLSM